MYNAASKLALATIAALALWSCSEEDPDKKAAAEMASRAQTELNAGHIDQALALMDSVDKQYPSQIEARRLVTALRPKAREQQLIGQIALADSMIAASQLEIAALEGKMKHISGDDLEGYYVVADAYAPEAIDATGFEPRVNDHDFTYYIVANVRGNIGISQVALVTPAAECLSQPIPARSARVMAIEGSEIASFLPEEVDSLGAWAYDHAADIKSGMIYGRKGNQRVALKPAQAAAFGTAWRYANQKLTERKARIMREKLDRALQIARDQMANHPVEMALSED